MIRQHLVFDSSARSPALALLLYQMIYSLGQFKPQSFDLEAIRPQAQGREALDRLPDLNIFPARAGLNLHRFLTANHEPWNFEWLQQFFPFQV